MASQWCKKSRLRKVIWPLLAVPLFALATGALFPLVALKLDNLGFGEAFIGSVTSLYYAGSVIGALTYGLVVNRIGYKAAFVLIATLAAAAAFALSRFDDPDIWLSLRFLGGYALGGYYIVMDSWMSALGTRQTRGRLFALYETIRLLATGAGPLLIIAGSTTASFTVVAIGYGLSIVPVLRATDPHSRTGSRDLSAGLTSIARCFPLPLAVAFCGGVANASFYGLSAIYAKDAGLAPAMIAVFVGIVLVAPAISEIPIGALADRQRRMPVAVAASFVAVASCAFIIITKPTSVVVLIIASVFVGGCLVPLYALSLARIVDAVGEREVIRATTAGLLAYNAGALCGPVAAGLTMEQMGPGGLYLFLGLVATTAMLAAIVDTANVKCCPETAGTPASTS
ncbi:MAG: MFS transporter [Cyanobacteria bacterium P01_A01_bin.135]